MIVASVKFTYVEPSALTKLYLHEPQSQGMANWRRKNPDPLVVTLFGKVEITNAIARARRPGFLNQEQHDAAQANFENDFNSGQYLQTDPSWRAVLRRAREMSLTYPPVFYTRTLDILHVATAIELGMSVLVTFDHKQAIMAQAVGLKVVTPVI